MQLVLLLYKNYYNRESYKEDSVQDYYDKAKNSLVIYDYDFNENDGVNTTAIVGSEEYDYETSDYLLVVDNNEIRSRWYILDANRTRYGQYQLTLRRDVLADNWDTVIQSPMFIEKATVSDDSPYIYNQENVLTNKIKTKETLIQDDHDSAYIAMYIAPNAYQPAGATETPEELAARTFEFDAEYFPDYVFNTNFESWTYYPYLNQNIKYLKDSYFQTSDIWVKSLATAIGIKEEYVNRFHCGSTNYTRKYGGKSNVVNTYLNPVTIRYGFGGSYNTYDKRVNNNNSSIANYMNGKTLSDISVYFSNSYDNDTYTTAYEALKTYDGKLLKFSNGLYRIRLNNTIESTYSICKENKVGSTIFSDIQTIIAQFYGVDFFNTYRGNENLATYGVGGFIQEYAQIAPTYETITARNTYKVVIPTPSNRLHLKDAPYDLVYLMYPTKKAKRTIWRDSEGTETIYQYMDSIAVLSVAQGIAKKLGSNLIDMQLLPYSSIGNYISQDTQFTYISGGNSTEDNKRYTSVTSDEGNTFYCMLVWATKSTGSKNISIDSIELNNKKIQNQTDVYRISSGNYSSSFEINPSKNGGIKNFKVDYTYIPYNPYYRVYPEFNNLYGGEFKDNRGLIDQSDKSLSYLSDAWIQYQIQNKTYQQQFDRQLQNMEVNQNITRHKEAINAGTAIVGGGMAGFKTNGTSGAILGASTALANQAANIAMNEISYQEQVDYSKDMFAMNLENIQALPNTMAKITAYNEDNKIFPILEYYTCTEEEREALANKIKYTGMTVGAIGKIADYINNEWSYGSIFDKGFIKGQLIQANDISDDDHIVNAIATELFKGVYTK